MPYYCNSKYPACLSESLSPKSCYFHPMYADPVTHMSPVSNVKVDVCISPSKAEEPGRKAPFPQPELTANTQICIKTPAKSLEMHQINLKPCSLVCNVHDAVCHCLVCVFFLNMSIAIKDPFLPFMKWSHGWISTVSLLNIKRHMFFYWYFLLIFCNSRHFWLNLSVFSPPLSVLGFLV